SGDGAAAKRVSYIDRTRHDGMSLTHTDFEWQILKVESQTALADFFKDSRASDQAVLPGPPRLLSATLIEKLGGRKVNFLDLSSIASTLEYSKEDQVIGVESGISLQQLDDLIKPNGQWFPVAVEPQSTLLFDALITGDGGYLDHQFGGFRDLVLGLKVVL